MLTHDSYTDPTRKMYDRFALKCYPVSHAADAASTRGFSFFTLQCIQSGWMEHGKVISECILKCNFFIQITDILHE